MNPIFYSKRFFLGALLMALLLPFSCNETSTYDDLQATVQEAESAPPGSKDSRRGVKSSATVRFGDENAGSPFPPGSGHDQSIHAADKMVPRTVVIAVGGEVHYELAPFHQVAIYAPGKTNGDVDLSDAALDDLAVPFPPFLFPNFIINDPVDRVGLSPPLMLAPSVWTTPPGTFDTPGKYLVICTTLPHFEDADMFGWVQVK